MSKERGVKCNFGTLQWHFEFPNGKKLDNGKLGSTL